MRPCELNAVRTHWIRDDPHQVASVAQLAEQLTLNQLVEGSSPSRGTIPLLFIFEFGKPTYKGTRIMVWQILEALAHGESVDDLVRAWRGRVSRAAVLENNSPGK